MFFDNGYLSVHVTYMSVCVCMRECSKGQLEVGAFYLFAFRYLKKKKKKKPN